MRDLTLGWRQYRLERRMFWRNPSAAFFNFLFPLILLGLFGAVFSHDQKTLNVLVPGIAGMSVMSTTFTGLAFNMTFLREQGVLKRIRGTPMPGPVYLGAIAANAVTNTVVQIALITVGGKAFFGIPWPKAHSIPSFEAAPAYVNAIFLPTIFISGVFYDVSSTPQFLRDIAEALPLKHVVDGLSGAMVKGTALTDHLDSLAVIAIWAAIGIVLAVRGFSWDHR